MHPTPDVEIALNILANVIRALGNRVAGGRCRAYSTAFSGSSASVYPPRSPRKTQSVEKWMTRAPGLPFLDGGPRRSSASSPR